MGNHAHVERGRRARYRLFTGWDGLRHHPDRYAIKLWLLKNGQHLHNLQTSFTGAVTSLAFTPEGDILASGHYDGVIRLWDVGKGSLLQTIESGAVVQSLAFTPDGSVLAAGHGYDDTLIQLYDTLSTQLLRELDGHQTAVDNLSFSPDGIYLASGSYNGTVYLWGLRP